MAYCIKCGKEIDDGKKLCDECAAELNKPDEEQSAAEQSKPEPDDADNTEKKPGRLKRLISGITRNKKRLLIIIGALVLAAVIAVVILFLTHILCIHKWSAATCTQPEICSICDRTHGTPLGHKNDPATCTEDAVCTVCGETVEKAFGHDWTDATCTEPETCLVCGETQGEALGHTSKRATCTEDALCSVCHETVEKALGHTWRDATCTKAKICLNSNCTETSGKPLGHTYESATCTENSICSVCGALVEKALGHDWIESGSGKSVSCNRCSSTCEYIGLFTIISSGKDDIQIYKTPSLNTIAAYAPDNTNLKLYDCGQSGNNIYLTSYDGIYGYARISNIKAENAIDYQQQSNNNSNYETFYDGMETLIYSDGECEVYVTGKSGRSLKFKFINNTNNKITFSFGIGKESVKYAGHISVGMCYDTFVIPPGTHTASSTMRVYTSAGYPNYIDFTAADGEQVTIKTVRSGDITNGQSKIFLWEN